MECKLTVTGIEQAIEGCDEAIRLLRTYVTETLEWFGRTVTQEAKNDHPYQDRTYHLTSSIGFSIESWSVTGIQVNVFATASYADAVEYGTATSRPYPFLYPKFYQYVDELMIRVNDAVQRAIADGGRFGGART